VAICVASVRESDFDQPLDMGHPSSSAVSFIVGPVGGRSSCEAVHVRLDCSRYGRAIMRPSRGVVVALVVVLVLVAGAVTAWRAGWPPAIFGSSAGGKVLLQSRIASVSRVGPKSSTPYRVAEDAYVSDSTAWNHLPSATRKAALARLRVAERRFRAMGTKVVPQQPSLTVSPGRPPRDPGQAATLQVSSGGVVLAARAGSSAGQLPADFGATAFGASALSFGTPGLLGWTPCVSVTPPGGKAVKLCGGKILAASSYSAPAGLTESVVATIGEGSAQAYVPVTASYTNQTGKPEKLVITGSIAAVSMTMSEPSLSAAGCSWSKLRYDTPSVGVLSPKLPSPPMIDLGSCLSSFSFHLALPNAYVAKLTEGMAAVQKITNYATDAYTTVANASQYASAPARQACATGQILSDLSAFFTDFGGVGTPSCQPTVLPTWTGRLRPGQTLAFHVTPAISAVDGGAGTETTGLFTFIHLHFAAVPPPAPPPTPEFYVHNGIELGSLYKYPDFPASIELDNHDGITSIHWTHVGPSSATATGTLNVDNCTPSCAGGTYVQYPVQLTASNPMHCTVAVYQQYSDVSHPVAAYVFNKIQVTALSGNPPSYLVGSPGALPPACG